MNKYETTQYIKLMAPLKGLTDKFQLITHKRARELSAHMLYRHSHLSKQDRNYQIRPRAIVRDVVRGRVKWYAAYIDGVICIQGVDSYNYHLTPEGVLR